MFKNLKKIGYKNVNLKFLNATTFDYRKSGSFGGFFESYFRLDTFEKYKI